MTENEFKCNIDECEIIKNHVHCGYPDCNESFEIDLLMKVNVIHIHCGYIGCNYIYCNEEELSGIYFGFTGMEDSSSEDEYGEYDCKFFRHYHCLNHECNVTDRFHSHCENCNLITIECECII